MIALFTTGLETPTRRLVLSVSLLARWAPLHACLRREAPLRLWIVLHGPLCYPLPLPATRCLTNNKGSDAETYCCFGWLCVAAAGSALRPAQDSQQERKPAAAAAAFFLASPAPCRCRLPPQVSFIAVGTIMASLGEVNLSLVGLFIMFLSETFEALRLVMTQMLLTGLKFHPSEARV